jgi:hypothetical protein
LENLVARFIGLAFLSLRGARFLAYASERAPQSLPRRLCEADFSQPKQSQRLPRFARNDMSKRARNDRGEARNDKRKGARNDKRAWSLLNQAAAKIWRRDLQEPVSSFYFGDGRGSITRFTLVPRLSPCPVTAGHDGADGQDYYRGPCSALDNEGAGRSWAINDTSNPILHV